MQFLKTITILSAAIATAVQAAPQGRNRPTFGQQSSLTTSAAGAAATGAATGDTANQPQQAASSKSGKQTPAAAQPAQANGGASATKTGSTPAQSSSTSGSSKGGAGITVVNSCSKTIYITVSQNGGNKPAQAVAPGSSPNFPIAGSDMNLKIGYTQDVFSGNIAQAEYSVVGGSMSWDLSLIDGNPFKAEGTSLVPSGGSGSTCIPVHCPPGAATCPNAYNSNADNSLAKQPTWTCPSGTALTFTACSG